MVWNAAFVCGIAAEGSAEVSRMTTIAVNVRLFLAILCSLALICTFLLIATDTTDEKRDFVHYVMYILVFLLEIGMEVTIMLFVGGEYEKLYGIMHSADLRGAAGVFTAAWGSWERHLWV